MGYLRNDGKYKIYIIKYLYKDEIKRGWADSGECHQWIPNRHLAVTSYIMNLFNPFTACGKCWQKTGIHGSFIKKDAIRIFNKISEWNPQHRFKVCRLLINQVTEDVVEKKYARIA